MKQLILQLEYDIKKDDYFIKTNLKKERVKSFVESFIRTQTLGEKDKSKAQTIELYKIEIQLNLDTNNYLCKDNCGNQDLRNGILLRFLRYNELKEV